MTRTILVTGATSGIGFAFCEAYSKKNYQIILVARSQERLQSLSKQLTKNYGVQTFFFAKDLSKEGAAFELFQEIKAAKLKVDILINNAGFSNTGLFTSLPLEKIHQEMTLNIVSLTKLTHLFLDEMKQQHSGTIINLASIASFYPAPYESVYAATKAYVLSFSEALQYEYQEFGIRVLAVCPGYTKTSFFDGRQLPYTHARNPEMVVATTLKTLKTKKISVIDGFGNQLQFLLSRLLPRKLMLMLTGDSGKKAWADG